MDLVVKSSFFINSSTTTTSENSKDSIADDALELIDDLNQKLAELNLPASVKCVYNPSIYARHTFEMYLKKYCNTKKKILYFGMNPGPWGMSQTGVC